MGEPVDYDEFAMFHENAAEHGLPYPGPPAVRRVRVDVEPGRALSALVWGERDPELVLLHGGSQNAHTWDTVALALGRPLVAIDLPGHGHSDGPCEHGGDGPLSPRSNASDVAVAVRALAPSAAAVVGMSLGGLTTIALMAEAPDLVRRAVLVDVLPGIRRRQAEQITAFVNGPPTFASFDELLERTIRFNPTRSVSSLRRGILHNAEQREDGTWVWRWARWRRPETVTDPAGRPVADLAPEAPMYLDLWPALEAAAVPVLVARGMRPQSVLSDEDEQELRRRVPGAAVVHFAQAGHSIQGDMPLELAAQIDRFASA